MSDPFEEDDVAGVFEPVVEPEPDLPPADHWDLTVLGPPRTKKTSNEIHLTVNKQYVVRWVRGLQNLAAGELMRAILMKVKVQPNKRWRQWAKHAPIIMQPELPIVMVEKKPVFESIDCDVHITAVFYRERAAGDLLGYEQGLADLLEQRKVIVNDRQLVCWDGSKLDKDKERPRVELMLHRVGEDVPPETKNGGEDALQESLPLDG